MTRIGDIEALFADYLDKRRMIWRDVAFGGIHDDDVDAPVAVLPYDEANADPELRLGAHRLETK